MPEQLTRHPEVTLQVLQSAGVACGRGEPPKILVACPADRFCTLPGGELCIYGLPEAASMTQIGAADWRALAAAEPAPPEPAALPVSAALTLVLMAAALGAAVGWGFGRRRRP